MLRKKSALYLLIICVLLCCVQKKLWQGKYTTVSYTSIMPKEDFKVRTYVVVAYDIREVDKYSAVIYRFDVMERNKKIGVLELCDRSSEDARFSMVLPDPEYKYLLLAGEIESAFTSRLGVAVRGVYRKYKDMPDYDVVKIDVTDVLSQ